MIAGFLDKTFWTNVADAFAPIEEQPEAIDGIDLPVLEQIALTRVPSAYVPSVFAFLQENDDAARQVVLLQQLAWKHRRQSTMTIDELILGRDANDDEQLEQYVRISAPRDAFNEIKQVIRAQWRANIAGDQPLVFPILIRRVGDV